MKFISTFWERLEEFILVALFAFMAVMNFLNVVFRYCFANSFSFTEEVTITAFVWVSMIGIAVGYKRAAHLGMSFFVDNMPKKLQAFMVLVSMVCSVVLLVLLMNYGTDVSVQDAYTTNAIEGGIMIPMAPDALSSAVDVPLS